jgi:hypothetical protein
VDGSAADGVVSSSELFGYPHELPTGFENRSTYIFLLEEDEKAELAAELERRLAASGGFGVAGLRAELAGASPAAAGDTGPHRRFRANVLVTRERTGRSLAEFVDAERADLARRGVPHEVIEDGDAEVAGLPARRAVMRLPVEQPAPVELLQLQVVTLRDGWAYSFLCTTTHERFAQDLPRFEAFIAGWK